MSAAPIRLWCVMKSYTWDNVKAGGITLAAPAEGPQYIIPVFTTREQAVKWNGSNQNVYEMESFAITSAKSR